MFAKRTYRPSRWIDRWVNISTQVYPEGNDWFVGSGYEPNIPLKLRVFLNSRWAREPRYEWCPILRFYVGEQSVKFIVAREGGGRSGIDIFHADPTRFTSITD